MSCLQIDFWNVGQGDASTITLPDGEIIVIDVGPPNSTLAAWLNSRTSVTVIKYLLLTHNDRDHVGALEQILEIPNVVIEHAYALFDRDKVETRQILGQLARKLQMTSKNFDRLECKSGKPFKIWGENEISLLLKYPTFINNLNSTTPNSTSAVITINYDEQDLIVWGGDAPLTVVAGHATPNPVFLFGPHHGAPQDNRKKFAQCLNTLKPQKCFISAGSHNGFEHPKLTYLEALNSSGCQIICSQITNKCNIFKQTNGNHVINTNGLYGLPMPKGVFCHGHLRFSIENGVVKEDEFTEKIYRERISNLLPVACR